MAIRFLGIPGMPITKPGWYGPAKNCEKCGKWNVYLLDKERFCECGHSLNGEIMEHIRKIKEQEDKDK